MILCKNLSRTATNALLHPFTMGSNANLKLISTHTFDILRRIKYMTLDLENFCHWDFLLRKTDKCCSFYT